MMKSGLVILLLLVTGCTTSPPRNANDICDIFLEKDGWYDDALDKTASGRRVAVTVDRRRPRLHVREEIPFQTGRRVGDIGEIVSVLP